MRLYMTLSLPRALLNCTTLRKDPFSSSWGRFHQCSTTQTLRDFQHTTGNLYSHCIGTRKLYPIRTHFSLSVSPFRSISSPFKFLAICSQRHSLKRINPHIPSCSPLHQSRHYSGRSASNTSAVRYIIATTIVVLGLSYAAVPLYRMFCQASGYGGTVTKVDAGERVEKMEPVRERSIVVRFNADTSAGMRWHFKPQQKEITVVPGETALAFYTARNPTDKPVTGISTYNVVPFEAGQYFNKIQCFCFEEQILNPNEEVDMPVFFYIDPEFNDDPAMARVTSLTLSYTFFEAKEGDSIYLPVPQTHHTH